MSFISTQKNEQPWKICLTTQIHLIVLCTGKHSEILLRWGSREKKKDEVIHSA